MLCSSGEEERRIMSLTLKDPILKASMCYNRKKNISHIKNNYLRLLPAYFYGDSWRNLHKVTKIDFILRHMER